MFLIQVNFLVEGTRKVFLATLFFLFWEKYSNIFLIWEHISQIKKMFLNKFEAFAVFLYRIQTIRHPKLLPTVKSQILSPQSTCHFTSYQCQINGADIRMTCGNCDLTPDARISLYSITGMETLKKPQGAVALVNWIFRLKYEKNISEKCLTDPLICLCFRLCHMLACSFSCCSLFMLLLECRYVFCFMSNYVNGLFITNSLEKAHLKLKQLDYTVEFLTNGHSNCGHPYG